MTATHAPSQRGHRPANASAAVGSKSLLRAVSVADEIQRRQVRAFMRTLGALARSCNCAVALLAHVDKSTSRRTGSASEGYSGSTAWHNSARSRLFMARDDSGLLTIEHQKANLTQRREKITLEWPDGGLPRIASTSPEPTASAGLSLARAADAAIALLRILAEYESRKQFASPKPTARNNVYALLRSEPAFQRLKLNRDKTALIVTQCQRAGWIESADYKSSGKWCERWTVTKEGCRVAGLDADTSSTSHLGEQAAVGDVGLPTSPTYTGGMGGERARQVG